MAGEMTELKHTPGPWNNDEGLVNGWESRDRFKNHPSVDIYDAGNWPQELEEEAHANAALIAEAPAMVENVLLKLLNPANLNSAGIAKIIDESAQILTRMEGKEE